MVIRASTPRPFASLTVNGGVRVQEDVVKNPQITCTGATMGILKTVSWFDTQQGKNLACSCVCDGKERPPVVDTLECRDKC
jgi:hypothetical protein